MKLISLVIPVYNEEENVPRLYAAVTEIIRPLTSRYRFELLFTDNHSTDRTFQLLSELSARDERVRCLRFSRNFGYQRSIMTGYLNARGDAVIQLDCDLQDPPEMIEEFLRKWEEGYEVVYGVRATRDEPAHIEMLRKLFYRLIRSISHDDLPLDSGDFRLVDRRIVEELQKITDLYPYIRGTIANLGFRQLGIPYDRRARVAGESKFGLRDLFRIAIDGILQHSTLPLRAATYFGVVVIVLTLAGSLIYLVAKVLVGQEWPAGFATMVIFLLLSAAINALFLGVIGEYVGRIYQQQKAFPLTIVERELPRRG